MRGGVEKQFSGFLYDFDIVFVKNVIWWIVPFASMIISVGSVSIISQTILGVLSISIISIIQIISVIQIILTTLEVKLHINLIYGNTIYILYSKVMSLVDKVFQIHIYWIKKRQGFRSASETLF